MHTWTMIVGETSATGVTCDVDAVVHALEVIGAEGESSFPLDSLFIELTTTFTQVTRCLGDKQPIDLCESWYGFKQAIPFIVRKDQTLWVRVHGAGQHHAPTTTAPRKNKLTFRLLGRLLA